MWGVRGPRSARRVSRALPAAAVARLFAALPDPRAGAVVSLMVHMALRRCEVARLEMRHWDPVAGTLLVTGKGSHERCLPVPAHTREALQALVAERGAREGPMIQCQAMGKEGRPVTAATIGRWVKGWLEEAGVKHRPGDGVSGHALRHTAASDVLDQCGDVRLVQTMLGHSQLATTTIYLRRADLGKLRAAMEGRDYRETEPAGVEGVS